MIMLPPSEAIFLQITHPSERGIWCATEEEPTDVGMKKTTRNIVGVVIMIDKFMMATVVGRPREGRTFKGRGSKEQGVELHDRARLKGEMRK